MSVRSLDPRELRRRFLGPRFFSSARDAARSRRPSDGVVLAIGLGLAGLAATVQAESRVDALVAELLRLWPGLFGWFWEAAFILAAIWALAVIAAAAGARRLGLLRDLLVALVLGWLAVLAMGGGDAGPPALWSSGPPPVFPAVRLALGVAVLSTASPHLGAPSRRLGRWLLAGTATASVALGVSLPTAILAGLGVGLATGALVRLVFGSPGGVPTLAQVATALAELGVTARELRPGTFEARGVALVVGHRDDGRPILVKVYGRDARDGQLFATLWANLWYRDDTSRLRVSRRQQVESEGFVTLLAERAGAPVTPVLAAGVVAGGDALVVLEASGAPLWSLPTTEIDDEVLRSAWRGLDRLHDARITHGRLDGERILVGNEGVRMTDLVDAEVTGDLSARRADEAQLLVATALAVGEARALQAATDAAGGGRVAAFLPFLQPPVLTAESRRRLRGHPGGISALRAAAAAAAGVDPPQLEPIRRVTWGSVATAALLAVGAYVLVTAIAGLGLDAVLLALEDASPVWVTGALVVSPFIQLGQAFSARGASPKEVALGPLLLLQFAIQFVALAVPSAASRIALNVRFFRGVGLSATEAVAVGAIDSFVGFLVEALLIVVILVSGAATLDLRSQVTSIDISPWVVGLVALAVTLALLAVVAIPKVRGLLRAKVLEATSVLRSLRSPAKLALLLGGNIASRIVLAAVLSMSLASLGTHVPLAELLLVNTLVSLLAGILPVPGGIGVVEAATTAGLVAVGVDEATALAAVIVFRLVTFYLPPIWGALAARRLRALDYL